MRTLLLRILVWAGIVMVSALASACVGDNFAQYDVVNDTDQDLLTWATTFDCGDEPGHKEDYLDAEVVPRRSTYHYGQANFEPLQCAYVATLDRRVMSQTRARTMVRRSRSPNP